MPSAAAPQRTWAELHGGALSLAAAEAAARHRGPALRDRERRRPRPTSSSARWRSSAGAACAASPITRRCLTSRSLRRKTCSPIGSWRCNRLARGDAEALILEAGALLERLPPPEFIVSRSLYLATGDKFDPTRDDEAVERARLPARRAGRRARRVRGARRRVRRVPDRQRCTRARRSFRRRDRNAADVRRADAALGRAYRQDRDPARARVSVRRGGDQGVSRTLPRALPGRAGPLPGLPDDLRRAAAGGHRVLLAAVLQDDGVVVRLPARRHAVRRGRRRPRDARRVVATGRRALRAVARATSSGRSSVPSKRSSTRTSCARESPHGRRSR